jgi:two-component system, NtrC family, sensor kinase
MFRSIRFQIVALVGLMLLLAMAVYLVLATRILTSDKEATLYDVNALLAGTLAEELRIGVEGLGDKLRYFGAEQERSEAGVDRRARSLFSADDELLSVRIWRKEPGGWKQIYDYVDVERLASLNIAREELELTRKENPIPLDAVAQERLLLQNTSMAPDLALLRISSASNDGRIVVSASMRPERILRLARGTGLYRVFLVDGEGRVLAHPDGAKVLLHADFSKLPVVKDALAGGMTRGARSYREPEGEEQVAAWARLEGHRLAVVVEAPRSQVFKATEELTRRSLLFAVAVVSVALIIGIYFSRFVTGPLRNLETVMGRVSKGELGVELPHEGQSEVGAVVQAFNRMSKELQLHAEELDQKNAQLVQQEKLSAIGELSAGLAHEVKNPMVGIVGFAQLGQESTSLTEAIEYFQLIDSDARRANGILQNLLEFARPPDVTLEKLELNPVVQGAVRLCAHQLQLQGVKLEATYGDALPPIEGNGNQLRQVLLNLMMNAQQAMEQSKEKKLYVSTTAQNGSVLIAVRDTGPGMPPEVQKHIFEPFFTTKVRGKGTGLGLSVSASIVSAHKGKIQVESEPGQGTTFKIELPALKN